MTLNISYYLDGEARTTATLNRPLEQLAAAVSALQALSGDGGSSGRVVAHGVPAEGALVGDIVYLDNGVAKPALVRWNTIIGQDGRASLAESARPVGLVTARSGATVDIILSGRCADSTTIAAIDTLASTGPHYLSLTAAGEVTATRPTTAIRVLNRIDDQTILVDIVTESTEQHVHQSFTLSSADGDWEAEDSEAEDTDFIYVGDHANAFALLPVISPVVTVDGVVDPTFTVDYTNGTSRIKATHAKPSTSAVVTLYLTIPYTHDLPVVRAITTSGSPRLRVRDANGVVTLSLDEEVADDAITANAATAIHGYSSVGAPLITPVVSGLTAGANISITKDNQGRHTISSGYSSNTPLYPSFIDLNGVSAIANGGDIYYYFPAPTGKSISGVIPLLPPAANVAYKVYPFALATGKAAGFSGITFDYSLRVYQSPTVVLNGHSTEVAIPDAFTGTIAGVGVNGGTIALFTADFVTVPLGGPFYVTAGGQAFLTLTKSAGSAAYLSGFGIIVVPEPV